MNNYIIIHGSFGLKDGNWFPWLKQELEKQNKKVDVPQMPIGVGTQNFENWSKELDKLNVNENTIIIAHSIAPIFVCKYLITNNIKVKKLVFVCGFNNYFGIDENFDLVNSPMYIDNYMDVKNCCSDITCFYSDNDPYVKFEVEKEFADIISNKQYIINGGGHLNSESGYIQFESVLKVLEDEEVRYAVRVFAFKDDKVVCIKYKNINKHYFDIPGGKIEKGETEVQTCIREFKEETGMDINDLKYVGTAETVYQNKKYIMKTYIANKIYGEPLEFEDNYSYWMPINNLIKNEKRFAITQLLNKELIKYFKYESHNFNIIFTCDYNHNIINTEIKGDV